MVSHESSLFNYLPFYTHRISITDEEHVLDGPSQGLHVLVCFWECSASPKTCLRVSPKSAFGDSVTLIPTDPFNPFPYHGQGNHPPKDITWTPIYFVGWLPCIVLHMPPFKDAGILIFIPSLLSAHSWVVASNQNKLAVFFLSVVEIRSEQTSCAHEAHTTLSNTVPFTASAYQLKRSPSPICPQVLLLEDRLIFNKHSLKVGLNHRLLGHGFPSASKINEMAPSSSERVFDSCILSLAYDVPLQIKHHSSLK